MLKLAAMSAVKTLEQFDRDAGNGAPKAQILELAHLVFVERADNVVLLGPSGVGKTHIALALAYQAIMAGHMVRVVAAADLMLQLAPARAQRPPERILQSSGDGANADRHRRDPGTCRSDVRTFGREEANLFFTVVAKRYERGSIVLTSNLPFRQWAGPSQTIRR